MRHPRTATYQLYAVVSAAVILLVISTSSSSRTGNTLSDGFIVTASKPAGPTRWKAQSSDLETVHHQHQTATVGFDYKAEVVGSTGRVGSFFLVYGSRGDNTSNSTTMTTTSSTIACPRGLSPGCLTPIGRPIWVATPRHAWNEVIDRTVPNRRQDLVLVGNGVPIPSYHSHNITVVVPHFGILERCRRSISLSPSPSPIITQPDSPPTYVFGPHSKTVYDILYSHGVQVEVVRSMDELRARAAQKLLWASCLWLLCHNSDYHHDNERGDRDESLAYKKRIRPCTIGEVYETQRDNLRQLVDELLPIMNMKVGSTSMTDDQLDFSTTRQCVDDYMTSYSMSIADAIPSKDLALSEFFDRNGYWLEHLTSMEQIQEQQPFHLQLLRQHLSDEKIQQACAAAAGKSNSEDHDRPSMVEIRELGMTVWGRRRRRVGCTDVDERQKKNAIIVGGGMIGSSVALALAQKRPDWNITVIDQMNETENGKTTKASWAWINANNKHPNSYQNLNHLGVQAWKRHPILKDLISWTGSLVRFSDIPSFITDSSYPVEGPLSTGRITELEPLADWDFKNDPTINGFTFFFPDEGCVDPSDAISALRVAARKAGVHFESNRNVTNVFCDSETGRVSAVEFSMIDPDGGGGSGNQHNRNIETMVLPADVVIVAAGCGSKASFLGGLPLVDRPGTIQYARTTKGESTTISTPQSSPLSLKRILVDPSRHSHVLQRSNGDIVIGGGEGALEFGGKQANFKATQNDEDQIQKVRQATDDEPQPSSLLDLAHPLAPLLLQHAKVTETHGAVRPMPKDGLPIVGYVHDRPGLYTLVTHSGITLGPLLSYLACCEITEDIDCEILYQYRPDRFYPSNQTNVLDDRKSRQRESVFDDGRRP